MLEPAGAYLKHFLGLDIGQDQDLGMKGTQLYPGSLGRNPRGQYWLEKLRVKIYIRSHRLEMCVCVWVSHSVVSDSFQAHRL